MSRPGFGEEVQDGLTDPAGFMMGAAERDELLKVEA